MNAFDTAVKQKSEVGQFEKQLAACRRKKRYPRHTAQREARRLSRQTGITFATYECPVCFWHHLTTGEYVEEQLLENESTCNGRVSAPAVTAVRRQSC